MKAEQTTANINSGTSAIPDKSRTQTTQLLRVQISVALVAIVVTVLSLYQLIPLNEKLAALKAEVTALEAKRDELRRNNNALAASARQVDKPGDAEAWLYVGRLSSDRRWAPLSEGVAPAPDSSSTTGISRIVVTKNTRYVEKIEGGIDVTSDAPPTKGPVRLVRAGTELPVLTTTIQPSIGGGGLVWVRVKIPSSTILELSS